jgi:hypothetical protein
MEHATGLSDKGEMILTSVGSGDITPSEAQSLMNAISSQVRIIEADELSQRIEALEERILKQ